MTFYHTRVYLGSQINSRVVGSIVGPQFVKGMMYFSQPKHARLGTLFTNVLRKYLVLRRSDQCDQKKIAKCL